MKVNKNISATGQIQLFHFNQEAAIIEHSKVFKRLLSKSFQRYCEGYKNILSVKLSQGYTVLKSILWRTYTLQILNHYMNLYYMSINSERKTTYAW